MPPVHPFLDFGFRIFPAYPRCDLRSKGALTGGAWHPLGKRADRKPL
jgi:hypothetical protein